MDSTTSRSDLNAIKSRLGSIAPSRFYSLPVSVQKLLSNDMPALIEEIEACRKVVEAARKLHDMEHVRHVEENIPTSKWVANLYSALKELDGDK